MNYAMIRYGTCRSLQILGILFVLPLLTALLYREWYCAQIFAGLAVSCNLIGAAVLLAPPKNRVFYAREGFIMTALVWIVYSLIGALPFYLSGVTTTYVDAFFETVSGLTTTGASILVSVDGMYRSVQFWRCFTHWIGGMGVLVFMLAILPLSEGYTMHLMRAESPGPSVGKFVPRVKNTSRLLYLIYLAFTVAEALLLRITGMPLFDAITLTFSTVGTGGFSVTDQGINPYPLASQIVIIFFMTLCGVNFSVFYLLFRRRPKEAFKCEEAKWYLFVVFAAAALIALDVYAHTPIGTPYETFHHALFTVSSVMTTTGFATADFNLFPSFSKTLLFVLMLIGACAGSTGGGFKYSRLIILVRRIKNEFIFFTHPKSVRQVYMDGRRVEGTTVKSVMAYLGIYVFVYLISLMLLSLNGFDFETNVTAIAATMNNIGPGFAMVGATGNYSAFSAFSKLLLSFDMLAGRLELVPVLMLIRRNTYRNQ